MSCLLGISVWHCLLNVSAQDAPAPIIRRAPLDVVYISDVEGNKIEMPGWSPTMIDDLYKSLFKDQQDPVPAFILRKVSATGKVVGNYVEIDTQIELVTSTYLPVQVPLGFREGILPNEEQAGQPTFRYAGTGSASLTINTEERQYVAVVIPQTQPAVTESELDKLKKPDINQQHALSLLLWFPLVQNNGEDNYLAVSFPQSNSSQLLLEVPMSNITASVTQGWLFEKQDNVERQSTLIKIQGLRTDTEIVWGKKKTEIADDRPVLLVEGASIDVRLDASTAIAVYDAVLPVSSATGSFGQLQIRLPQGSTLDRETTDRYAVAGDYSVGDVDEESIATILLHQKTSGPVPLRLRVFQQFEGVKSDLKREIAGFEILGAERQTGFLAVSVFPLEMKPHWDLVQGVRRLEEANQNTVTPVTSAVPAAGVARFEFISQPFLLRVRAATQPTRINVKPDYLFRIRKGSITMTARFTYTVSGTRPEALYLRLSDSQWWDYDVGMSSIVDTAFVDWEDEGLLKIPLLNSRDGTFDIELRAYRSIPVAGGQVHRIILPMPEPQADWSDPAWVIIASENDVEVVPINESSSAVSEQHTSGLIPQSRRAVPAVLTTDLTNLRQEPHFYRMEPSGAVFVADLISHQPKVNVAMRTDVRLFEDDYRVTQTISYDTAYAPINRLYFLLPKSLASSGDVQVTWDNNILEFRDTISDIQENVPDNFVRKLVQLPDSVYQFQLTFQYSPPPLAIAAEGTTSFPLSFISPSGVSVSDHRVHFFAPSGYKVELQNESKLSWETFRESRRPATGAAETFRSVTSQSPTRIALFVSDADQSISRTTLVERAWLQTRLTGALRADRATYLLKSTSDSVTLQLPPDAVRENPVIVRIDHRQILPNISPTGMLTIPILPEQQNLPVEVTVDYRYPFEISGFEVPLVLPVFAKEISMRCQIWEVILHQDKHIIGSPAGWTQEYNWAWNGLFWWRVPSIRQSDIGFDIDSTATEPAISEVSQYVFSHLQPPENVKLYIVNRSLIVFCSSGIALFVGLMLIYVPQSRYAGSLFGLGIVLLAVLFYQPPLALLMLQAAVFGVFLALGTGYVYRVFHRQRQWIPPAFQSFDEIPQPYVTPIPVSQTVHEVVMDESTNKETAEPPADNNGQS